jgi:ABC-type lipoprotein release transport system permease subunit
MQSLSQDLRYALRQLIKNPRAALQRLSHWLWEFILFIATIAAIIVAIIACVAPARHTSKIEPMMALRHE